MSFKTSQGVTAVVVGNCGISLAPLCFSDDRPPAPLDLLGDGYKFPRMADFVAHLEANPQPPMQRIFAVIPPSELGRWTI